MLDASVHATLVSALKDLQTRRDEIDRAIKAMQTTLREFGAVSWTKSPTRTTKRAHAPKARRNWSRAARQEAAERMRRYWADRKRSAARTPKK